MSKKKNEKNSNTITLIAIFNEKNQITVPLSHKNNYVGKGWKEK